MGGLFGSAVLDVVLGLIFIYLMLSIICTAANEWIAGVSRSRSKVLKWSIEQLLSQQPVATDDPVSPPAGPTADADPGGFLQQFNSHRLVSGMMHRGRYPAYIPARVFSKVVVDLVTPHKRGKLTYADFELGVHSMPEGAVKESLLALMQDADEDLDSIHRVVEGWFEDKMDRAAGWYKRRTQFWTIAVAVFITVAANADTFRMTQTLWNSPELRAAFVEEAKGRAQEPRPSVSVEYPDPDNPDNPVVTELGGGLVGERERALLGQVLGWQGGGPDAPRTIGGWLQRLLGWLITVLAISLGAPFWFDLLNKVVNVRAAGKSPDETPKRPEKKKLPPEDKTA